MVVQHNLLAMNANRQFNITTKKKRGSSEKLSSGYKINRAADNAAGLSISEKMRNQIRGLNQALNNIDDGISMIQTADGALNETHSILHRIEELAVRASNDTNATEDRKAMDDEVQQLKNELRDIFQKTEFNGKKIFAMPYVPEISGTPNDMQVFQSRTGEYGGVSIKNVRYTWEEVGISFNADGSFTGQEIEFNAWDGERVRLVTRGNTFPPMVERNYDWKATDEGIFVNNKLAASWNDMGINPGSVQSGKYSFDYCGTTVNFEVPAGDKIKDVINGINNRDFDSQVTWNSVPSISVNQKAVDIMNPTNEVIVKNNFKQYVEDVRANYSIYADASGVELKDTKGGTHTKIRWEDFNDPSLATESGTNGGYPIVDWGLDNDGNRYSDTTFDDTAVYHYRDNVTGFEFDFQLADEASREAVLRGMNVPISTSLRAPVRASSNLPTSLVNPSDNFALSFGAANLTYKTQLDCDRNFDNATYNFRSSQIAMTDDGGNYKLSYDVAGSGGTVTTLNASISKTAFRTLAENGGASSEITFQDGNGNSMKTQINIRRFKPSDPNLKTTNIAQYNAELDAYVGNALNAFLGASVTINATDYARQKTDTNEASAGNVTAHTEFGVVLNPPEKNMDVQSGANQGELTNVAWKGLNLSVIGMGSTNTLTGTGSQAAIGQVQRAVKIISAERSKFGAMQNRLETTYNNDANYAENLTSAESVIRDTDIAEEMMEYSKHNILEQAGQAVMSQANKQPESVLNLLQ